MMPMVSIIIPVYNGSNYMREALDSALNQTYSSTEVIVVNDGSTDDGKTRAVALSYGRKIRYFEKDNGGVSTALNLGIQHMKGEYFSWLSHDDVYFPEKIAVQIQALQESGDMTLPVYSGWGKLRMPEKIFAPYTEFEKRYSGNFFASGLCAVSMGLISGCSLLIHKSYFEKYGLFDDDLRTTQDYTKWFEMFKDKRMIYISMPLIQSRIHEMQTGATYKNFLQECDELYLWMMQNITQNETKLMKWDLYQYYSAMLSRLYTSGYSQAYKYVYKRLTSLPEPEETGTKIKELRKYLEKHAERIYLYCAGKRGQALLDCFKLRGIQVEGFCDSNRFLWGKEIKGEKCFPLEMIDKNKSLLIVTKACPETLKRDLCMSGFKNVITYNELEELLTEVPAARKHILEYRKDMLL